MRAAHGSRQNAHSSRCKTLSHMATYCADVVTATRDTLQHKFTTTTQTLTAAGKPPNVVTALDEAYMNCQKAMPTEHPLAQVCTLMYVNTCADSFIRMYYIYIYI